MSSNPIKKKRPQEKRPSKKTPPGKGCSEQGLNLGTPRPPPPALRLAGLPTARTNPALSPLKGGLKGLHLLNIPRASAPECTGAPGTELFPRGPGLGPPRAAAAAAEDEDGEEAAGTWVLPMGQGMRSQRVPAVAAMGSAVAELGLGARTGLGGRRGANFLIAGCQFFSYQPQQC